MELFSHISLCLITTLFHTVASLCPQIELPCRCVPSIYEPISFICENAGGLINVLNAIVNAQTHVIDSLTIVDTAINVLPPNAFRDYFILRLVLNRNHLSYIDPNAFAGPIVESLVELDLSDNNLQQIPRGGISALLNLRKLYLNRNRIAHDIQSDAFNYYASRKLLMKLELAANQLTNEHLSGGIFHPLESLRELSLETNALTKVPSSALENQQNTLVNLNLGLNQIKDITASELNFPHLSSLSLEFNGITTLSAASLQGIPHLRYLYLTGNKFPLWQTEMFRYINELRTLGIGETPIRVIPADAFKHIPNLMHLEMSEAALDIIEPLAFQQTRFIQAIVLNKNRLTRVHTTMFSELFELYSIDLQGNRINVTEPEAFANLPSLRHLDISFNQLETMPQDVFKDSFGQLENDRRVIYACANPWMCDSRLEWFRHLLRVNLDIDIDKPGCLAVCGPSPIGCPVEGTPLRSVDTCPVVDYTLPLTSSTLPLMGWIILAVILTILIISICLMALIRYGISRKRTKEKNQEIEDQQRIISSTVSTAHMTYDDQSYYLKNTMNGLELDLPVARSLDDPNHNNYI